MFNGERLREERKKAGLSQAKVAARAKCEVNTISRIELGHFRPKADLATRLAKAVGVSLASLETPVERFHNEHGPPGDERLILSLWLKMEPEEKTALLVAGDAILKRRQAVQEKTG
jgi:transcriptional regulator with XRE-family HTH domain